MLMQCICGKTVERESSGYCSVECLINEGVKQIKTTALNNQKELYRQAGKVID